MYPRLGTSALEPSKFRDNRFETETYKNGSRDESLNYC